MSVIDKYSTGPEARFYGRQDACRYAKMAFEQSPGHFTRVAKDP